MRSVHAVVPAIPTRASERGKEADARESTDPLFPEPLWQDELRTLACLISVCIITSDWLDRKERPVLIGQPASPQFRVAY